VDVTPFIAQIDKVLKQFSELKGRSENPRSLSDLPTSDIQRVLTLSLAAIDRIVGHNSPYSDQARRILEMQVPYGCPLIMIAGVLESLKFDLESGHLKSLAELIHGDIFADYLEMASYLSEEKYKDAAAVVAGSTLEAHLRQLCHKVGIDIEVPSASGVRPKKADQMNADLAKADVYSKLDQKSVTAWLDLRNKAAHGEYTEYDEHQVKQMIDGVRNFISRVPA